MKYYYVVSRGDKVFAAIKANKTLSNKEIHDFTLDKLGIVTDKFNVEQVTIDNNKYNIKFWTNYYGNYDESDCHRATRGF